MKRLVVIIAMLVAITGCQKSEIDRNGPLHELVFVGSDHARSESSDCDNPLPNYALIVIDGKQYALNVYYINGILYTNSLKFPTGHYEVESFLLMHDEGKQILEEDDLIVQAVPVNGSDYSDFVINPVPFSVTIGAFEGNEVVVETICYKEVDKAKFGFE